MYVPPAFEQADRTELFKFIEAHSFGLLVSQLDRRLFATHLPMLLDAAGGSQGRLLCHVARANPQWKELAGQEVLAVFSGPHAYVSPTWYEAEQVVPTWNYTAVHVYGRCQLVDDEAEVARILAEYVSTYERSMQVPWKMDASSPFVRKLMNGVVAFEIAITSIEGKWKLGQNHPAERRAKAARRLAERGDEMSRTIARLMTEIT